MTLGQQPGLERIAVGDVAVVRPVEMALADDFVRLRIGVVDRPEGRPAHLTAENLPGHVDDAELVDHQRWRADALDELDRLAVALDRCSRRVVAAVFERLEQFGGDAPEIVTRPLEDQSDHSTHGALPRVGALFGVRGRAD